MFVSAAALAARVGDWFYHYNTNHDHKEWNDLLVVIVVPTQANIVLVSDGSSDGEVR